MLPIDAAAVSDAVIGKGYTSGQPAGEVQHPTSREADPKEDPMVEQALSMLDLEYQRCIAAEAARREHAPALGTEDIAEATEAAEAAGYGAIGSIPCAFSDDDDDDNDEDGGFAYAALENDSDVEDMDASSSSAGMVRTSDGVPAGRLASSSSAVAGSDGDEHRPEDIPEAVVSAAEGHAAALLQERRSNGGGGGGGGGGDGSSGGGSGGDSAASTAADLSSSFAGEWTADFPSLSSSNGKDIQIMGTAAGDEEAAVEVSDSARPSPQPLAPDQVATIKQVMAGLSLAPPPPAWASTVPESVWMHEILRRDGGATQGVRGRGGSMRSERGGRGGAGGDSISDSS